jgi:hypothetical protein
MGGAGPPVWPLLLAAAIAAIWIDLGNLHAHHQSDTLIPVLVSLYYWTPFYWAQDRWGMLVPLLAMPFAHPFVNLLVQTGLGIFAGLAAPVLVARYVVRDPVWPLVLRRGGRPLTPPADALTRGPPEPSIRPARPSGGAR